MILWANPSKTEVFIHHVIIDCPKGKFLSGLKELFKATGSAIERIKELDIEL